MPDRRGNEIQPEANGRRGHRQTGGRRRTDSFPKTTVTKKLLVIVVGGINFGILVVGALIDQCNNLIPLP